MKWTTNEQTDISKNDNSDNSSGESSRSMFDEDDESSEERHSPNLSMDEVRNLLDEFEKILHAN